MTQSRWTPALVRALRHYSWPTFAQRPRRRASPSGSSHCRSPWRSPSRPASRPQAGIYCADRHRLPDFRARRLAVPDRRPDRRLRRRRRRHRRDLRRRRPVHVHDDGRRHPASILGLTGMGTAVKYLPRPVVIGFTNGIAVLIASTQIRDFFGLQMAERAVGVRGAHGGAGAARRARSRRRRRAFGVTALAVHDRAAPVRCRACRARSSRWSAARRPSMLSRRSTSTRSGSRFGGIPVGLPHLAIPQFRARADARRCSGPP